MSSINAVNGIPSAANIAFTVAQLRNTWNFEGFVTSDCGTISDLFLTHRFVNSTSAAVAAGMVGGTDVNCGHYYNLYMADALEQGLVSLEELQDAGARFLATVFELGLAEDASSSPFASWGSERIDSQSHRALALEGAQQGIVLLRNDNNTLPLNLSTISSLALVGPHLNASSVMLSSYVGPTRLDSENTPLLRISARAAAIGVTVTNALGIPTAHSNDTSGIAAAVALANSADVTIVFLGLDQVLEREGLDRDSLALPSAQAALLSALMNSGCRRLIVVLMSGGAISESALGAQALVASLYPGELGGEAIASLLLGEVAFSGRLPFTVPTLSWTARRNITDMHLAPHLNENGTAQIPGATNWYMDTDADILFPFGFGLSLTEWEWSWADNTACSNASGGEISIDAGDWARSIVSAPTLIVHVVNGGQVTSGISALGFISSGIAGEPTQKLFDFDRIARLDPGNFVDLTLQIPAAVAGIVDGNGTRTLQPGAYTVRVGGHAVSGGLLCTLKVTGQPAFIDALAF
jgi:beta-D-xylosidase 4